MDDVGLANRVRSVMREREKLINEMLMSGALRVMEQYKVAIGELTALGLIEETIKKFFKES